MARSFRNGVRVTLLGRESQPAEMLAEGKQNIEWVVKEVTYKKQVQKWV